MFVEYIYIYIYIYIWTVQPRNGTLKNFETETFHSNWKNETPVKMELTTLLSTVALVRCKQQNFGSECWFAADNTLSMNISLLHTTQFQQWTLVHCRQQQTLVRFTQHNFSSECWFPTNNTISVANTSLLQITQFWHQTLVRCIQHNFEHEHMHFSFSITFVHRTQQIHTISSMNTCISSHKMFCSAPHYGRSSF